MHEVIKLSTPEAGILQITLNRPEQLNALSQEVLQQLKTIFQDAKEDSSVKAILINGEGKGFCAGADIKQLAALNGAQGIKFAQFGQEVFSLLELMGKPSLAAIHGFAFGGGCELAMAATLRIAANNAVFGQPEIKLGVIPGFGGTQRLPRLIGKGRALEICLTARRFTAEEAFNWGWANEITIVENLLPRAMAILKDLINLGPVAMQNIITVIHEGYDLPLEQAFELEAARFGTCCDTQDKQEGVSAFLEKRVAIFTGV